MARDRRPERTIHCDAGCGRKRFARQSPRRARILRGHARPRRTDLTGGSDARLAKLAGATADPFEKSAAPWRGRPRASHAWGWDESSRLLPLPFSGPRPGLVAVGAG